MGLAAVGLNLVIPEAVPLMAALCQSHACRAGGPSSGSEEFLFPYTIPVSLGPSGYDAEEPSMALISSGIFFENFCGNLLAIFQKNFTPQSGKNFQKFSQKHSQKISENNFSKKFTKKFQTFPKKIAKFSKQVCQLGGFHGGAGRGHLLLPILPKKAMHKNIKRRHCTAV